MDEKIRLTKPFFSDSYLPAIEKILNSGYWTQGDNVTRFEENLAAYLGVKHAIVVSSGTAALHLSLLSLDIGANDEVILPSFSFAATANVVCISGASPVFVDIKLNDYCIDSDSINAHITKRTKAIMPVHEFGAVADMDSIMRIAEKHNLKVIEDTACALGSKRAKRQAGTFGDLGCFSFHPRKIITTGEGGAIVTNSDELAAKLKMLRSHGYSPLSGFSEVGLNYRMTELQAVIGIIQLESLTEIISNRREIAAEYNRELKKSDFLLTPQELPDIFHTYQTYHLLLQKGNRDDFIKYLAHKGIESTVGAQYLAGLPSMKLKKDFQKDSASSHKNSSNASENGVAIPIGSHLSASDTAHIIATIKGYKC